MNEKVARKQGRRPLFVASVATMQLLSMRIWSDPSVIDEYIAANKDLPKEQKEVLGRWKKMHISGVFALMECTDEGGLFLGEDNNIYLVKGLYDSWDTLKRDMDLPIVFRMTILPFRDVIISDGRMMILPMGQKEDIQKSFVAIRLKNGVIKRFDK